MSALEAWWGSGHGGDTGMCCHLGKLSEMQSSRSSAKEAADSGKCLFRAGMEFNSQDWELNAP